MTVLASVVMAVGGCSGSFADHAAPDTSAVPVRTSGPLAAGFEIEPGSALIGPVFPYGDNGLRVILRVDADLPRVFEEYVSQAAALGFPVSPSLGRPAGQSCSDDREEWENGRTNVGAFEVGCSAYGYESDQWSMSLSGLAGADGQGYIQIGGGEEPEPAPKPDILIPAVADGPVAPLTDVELAPDLAAAVEPVRVVQGSALLFEPLPSGCSSGGYTAMLQVTGELTAVMRGYREQYDKDRLRLALRDDKQMLFFREDFPGGGGIRAIGLAGDPSHILIDRCND
jgi:hypothetical protein